MGKKQPWYLKTGFLYFFCFVTPPIGYIIVVTNLRKFKYDDKINYLTITTLMMAVWVLKFLPDGLNLYVWCFILAVLIGNAILKFFKKK
ncbi:hypothetical protein JOD45_001206 [Scopulibacillus daqui]|uniref:Uncharacterized protein n=1 Tax=Scopulibacillus daqui TaxID=1469162 RepID=A0ABS2PY83_9BACL|nr:hypothetical protein [Scopulibacillus daqui]MBM7644997.1 hypothetical protein [Scopulibacillus daqui]